MVLCFEPLLEDRSLVKASGVPIRAVSRALNLVGEESVLSIGGTVNTSSLFSTIAVGVRIFSVAICTIGGV